MRKHLIPLLCLCTLFALSFNAFGDEYPLAYYNFTDKNALSRGEVVVDAEWDFFWGKFVETDDYFTEPDCTVRLPGIWNSFESLPPEAKKIAKSGRGSGTYRILLTGLKPNASYSFFTYDLASTAFEAYADNKLIYKCGTPCEDWTKTKAQSMMDLATFRTDLEGNVMITIYVSNNFYRKGGIWTQFKIQEEQAAYDWYNRRVSSSSLILAVFLTVVLYSFLVSFLKKDKANLYLGLFAFAIFVRLLCSEFPMLKHFVPGVPYEIMLRLEFFALYTGPALYTLYLESLDAGAFGKIKGWWLASPALVFLAANILPIRAVS